MKRLALRISPERLRRLLGASCLLVAVLSHNGAYAETRTAADLTPEAVGKAIDAAQDGDTVRPPAGKADGTNPLDGNQIPAGQVGAGYPCFGQVGWATNVDGVFKPTPCYAWNNTCNGAKFPMAVTNRNPNVLATIKEGREFFNFELPAAYYKPYVYPHPLQDGWDALMKSVAARTASALLRQQEIRH